MVIYYSSIYFYLMLSPFKVLVVWLMIPDFSDGSAQIMILSIHSMLGKAK